jgi:hypothetical protein
MKQGRLAAVRPGALFVFAPLHTCMEDTTFAEYVARRDEGLLTPDRVPLKGLARLNATPFSNPRRKRLQAKPTKKPNPFAPTIRKVAEVVPNKFVANFKPLPPPSAFI